MEQESESEDDEDVDIDMEDRVFTSLPRAAGGGAGVRGAGRVVCGEFKRCNFHIFCNTHMFWHQSPNGTGRYRSVPVSTSAGTGPARQNCSQLSGGSGVGIPNVQKWGNSQ